MNKGNKDIKKIYASIENEYNLLKDFERGAYYGDFHRHLPLSPHLFITIVNRFYDYVGELEDNLFSFEEYSNYYPNQNFFKNKGIFLDRTFWSFRRMDKLSEVCLAARGPANGWSGCCCKKIWTNIIFCK